MLRITWCSWQLRGSQAWHNSTGIISLWYKGFHLQVHTPASTAWIIHIKHSEGVSRQKASCGCEYRNINYFTIIMYIFIYVQTWNHKLVFTMAVPEILSHICIIWSLRRLFGSRQRCWMYTLIKWQPFLKSISALAYQCFPYLKVPILQGRPELLLGTTVSWKLTQTSKQSNRSRSLFNHASLYKLTCPDAKLTTSNHLKINSEPPDSPYFHVLLALTQSCTCTHKAGLNLLSSSKKELNRSTELTYETAP